MSKVFALFHAADVMVFGVTLKKIVNGYHRKLAKYLNFLWCIFRKVCLITTYFELNIAIRQKWYLLLTVWLIWINFNKNDLLPRHEILFMSDEWLLLWVSCYHRFYNITLGKTWAMLTIRILNQIICSQLNTAFENGRYRSFDILCDEKASVCFLSFICVCCEYWDWILTFW
jgi:hypothetical protein